MRTSEGVPAEGPVVAPACDCPECGGAPKYWDKDSRGKAGGYWRCVAKRRQNLRRAYWNNPEKAREKDRRWRENNPEKVRESSRRYGDPEALARLRGQQRDWARLNR